LTPVPVKPYSNEMGKSNSQLGRAYPLSRNKEQLDPSKREIVFYEECNPKCVVNMLHPAVKKAAMEIPVAILSYSLTQLRTKLEPTEMDEQLRLSFWDEYFLASDANRMIRLDAVYARICSREHFYANIITNHERFAYVLSPPEEYMIKVRGLLELGLTKFAEILRLPLRTASGNVDSKLIGQIVTIVSILDNRVRGAVPQKLFVEGKQFNMNVNYESPKSYEEINSEIKNIEREILELQAAPLPELTEEQISLRDDLFSAGVENGSAIQGNYERTENLTIAAEAVRVSPE